MSPPKAPIRKITIFDRRTTTGERHVLTARVTDLGDLLLEGYDLGRSVKEFFGDEDFEYSRTVKAADVPAVLLHLIRERFANETEFTSWLDDKGISNSFDYYR